MIWFLACSYAVPVDVDAEERGNTVSGTVVINDVDEASNVFVLLYDATDPGPPYGTGSPVNFASVAAGAFTGGDGVESAPWSVTGLDDGTYYVTGVMDADGDFNPFVDTNAGSTCGDLVGAFVDDVLDPQLATFELAEHDWLDDVTIAIATELQVERPGFYLATESVSRTAETTQVFQLKSTGIYTDQVTLEGPYDGSDPCMTSFVHYAVDADADGLPDPHPNEALAAAGAYDIWPRIYLAHTAFESNGPVLYASEAAVYPDVLLSGGAALGVPTPLTTLNAIFGQAAQRYTYDSAGEAVPDEVVYGDAVPDGEWSVTLIQYTGQTWTVPNTSWQQRATEEGWQQEEQAWGLVLE